MKLLVSICSLGLASASGLPWPGFLFYPLDPQVGNVEEVSDEVLSQRIFGKTALIVGGTDGIGRGIALAMARWGANVTIVGHSPTKATEVLRNMSAIARYPHDQKFHAYSTDLFTVHGVLNFTKTLKESGATFDYAVLTVGIWPDTKNPRTTDGVDKVIALDVLARFLVTRELLGSFKPDARVMSVLGSTMRTPLPTVQRIKEISSGDKGDYSLSEILGTSGVLGDAWLQGMAVRKAPHISFIGTWPGVVGDDLIKHSGTFPKWLRPFLDFGGKLIGMKPEECGRLHTIMLSSPNVLHRPVSYFNIKLEGRKTAPLAYDKGFNDWVWDFLEQTVANHTNIRERDEVVAKETVFLV